MHVLYCTFNTDASMRGRGKFAFSISLFLFLFVREFVTRSFSIPEFSLKRRRPCCHQSRYYIHFFFSRLLDDCTEIIRVEERGCASQKYTQQKLENGRWVPESGIEKEIYKDGCFPEKQGHDLKAAKSEYCYCSSNLCNTGKRTSETSFFHHTDAMSVIFIFNVVKFMRNVR
jgi:hypothetical protein